MKDIVTFNVNFVWLWHPISNFDRKIILRCFDNTPLPQSYPILFYPQMQV
jgi:hypothetical protein